MATILDVANKVGVAKSTVSKVLNGNGRVSDATKKKVFKAVKELGYRPNVLARSLTKQSSDSIGLIIPYGYSASQYITKLIDMTQALANDTNKFLMITQVDGNSLESGIQSIRKLVDRRCDGIIYYKSSQIEESDSQKILEQLIDELPVPLVVLNSHLPNKPDHCVWFDNSSTAEKAVTYLLNKGHKNIAYISGRYNLQTSRDRLRGYQDALSKAGIEVNPLLIAEGDVNPYKGGYLACKQIIERQMKFSAICCFSDGMAIGALKALREHDLSVPEDVSLFGLDNDDIGEFTDPPLSSIAMPLEEIISTAGQMLFDLMQNKPPQNSAIALQGQLVHRSSA